MIECEIVSHHAHATPPDLFGAFLAVNARRLRDVLFSCFSTEIGDPVDDIRGVNEVSHTAAQQGAPAAGAVQDTTPRPLFLDPARAPTGGVNRSVVKDLSAPRRANRRRRKK